MVLGKLKNLSEVFSFISNKGMIMDWGCAESLNSHPVAALVSPCELSRVSQVCIKRNSGKESACNAGDLGSIPGLGRSPGEGKGYPLQYSGLENSMDSLCGRRVGHD